MRFYEILIMDNFCTLHHITLKYNSNSEMNRMKKKYFDNKKHIFNLNFYLQIKN